MNIAELRRMLAAKYPKAQAALAAAGDNAPPELRQQAMLCAVCADDQDAAMAIARAMLPNVPALRPLRLAPRATLAEYCRARGLPCATAINPLDVSIDASSRYTTPFRYSTEPTLFASVPGAQFIPGWDFVIGEDDSVLYDTGYLPPEVATHDFMTFLVGALNCLIHYAPAGEVYVDEDVLFLSAPWNSVGHWMVDFLPRLKGLAHVPGKVRLAVPADLPARHREMLAMFGIGEGDLLPCAPGKRHRFRMCHVYRLGRTEPPNPKYIRFVREGLLGGSTPAMRKGKKVFLGRSSVGTRMIANAAAFQEFLQHEGFVAVDPADLSAAGQKELLADAEIILGPFGSNLFGMYFAPAGCHVVTLINNPGIDPMVAPTAALLGLQHQYFVCASAPESGRQRYRKDTDIVVDCVALAERLREIETVPV